MTVRVVVTASGRVAFGGTGYAPTGEVAREGEGGGIVDGVLRAELERALAAADRANNAAVQERDGRWTVQGDPTEGALLVAARKAGLVAETLEARLPRIGELPFSSERKLMSTVHRDTEHTERLIVFAKGAPDVLLGRCTRELVGEDVRSLTPARRAEILQANEALADQALRTLGVAVRAIAPDALDRDGVPGPDPDVEDDLAFAGLIGMIDPPRAEARDAVARARRAGIRPLMITGDHPRTAAVIARELGIAGDARAITGAELDTLTDDALARAVREVSVYARVNPEHKLRIVHALQRDGAVVAMTGDGVNDAPALKTADIGIAMGITGTDVSKEAADIVLADDDFASIVAAVEEGRAIFDNIRKFLRFLLSSNIGEVLTMFAGVLLAEPRAAGGGGRGRRAAAAGDAGPLDQPGDRRRAGAGARRGPGRRGADGAPAAAERRARDHPAHVARHRARRRRDGRRHAPRARRIAAGRLRAGHRRPAVRADDGVHHVDAGAALQRPQRALRRAHRVRPPVREPVGVECDRAVARAAAARALRRADAARVRDRGPGRRGLAALPRRRECRALGARGEQARHAPSRPSLETSATARPRATSLLLAPRSP
jgi:phosphoglycolate phosphatase-like HAD superfamily hydrolase